MARIGRFLKNVGRGMRTRFNKFMTVAPKAIDISKRIIDNPITRTAAGIVGHAFGIPQVATQAGLATVSKGLGIAQDYKNKILNHGS